MRFSFTRVMPVRWKEMPPPALAWKGTSSPWCSGGYAFCSRISILRWIDYYYRSAEFGDHDDNAMMPRACKICRRWHVIIVGNLPSRRRNHRNEPRPPTN